MAETDRLVERLTEWANDYPAYLSNRTDYGKGYKEGIVICKEIIKGILIIRIHDIHLFYNILNNII